MTLDIGIFNTLATMKKQLFFLSTIICFCVHLTAQEIEFSLLGGRAAHKDAIVQPLVYTGNSLGFYFNFQKATEGRLITAKLQILEKLQLLNRLNDNVDQFNAGLSFSYTKRIFRPLKAIKLYTGAQLATNYNATLGYSISTHYYIWLTQYNIQWRTDAIIPISDKSHFELALSIPVAGLYSRPDKVRLHEFKREYGDFNFNKNLKFQSLNQFRSIYLKVVYKKQLNEKWGYTLSYQLYHIADYEPLPIKFMHQHLGIGINRNL